MASTMRTLLPLLSQPLLDAISTAQLRAARTQDSILDLAITNETFEYLLNILVSIGLGLLSHLSNS